jgi:hypothetical protein
MVEIRQGLKDWVFMATMKRVLEHTMLWDVRDGHIPDESDKIQQVVHTS